VAERPGLPEVPRHRSTWAAEFAAWLILAWLIVLAFLAGATWAFVRFV
jgi:hypothetical protein